MGHVRIWEGHKECCEKTYFVGQELILTGRLAGTYRNITKEYKTWGAAEDALRVTR